MPGSDCIHTGTFVPSVDAPTPGPKLLSLSQAQLSLLGKEPGSLDLEVTLLLQQGQPNVSKRWAGHSWDSICLKADGPSRSWG